MVAESLGRLFEVGFNIGILSYIEQNSIPHHFGELYRQDLQHLKFSEMLKRIVGKENIISEENIDLIEQWSLFLIQKGFLSGFNFFREYIKSTEINDRQRRAWEILYCQCSFCEDNSIKTYSKSDQREFRDLLSQFGNVLNPNDLDRYIQQYQKKGEFLKADTLMLLRRGKQFRILSVDLSVFSVRSSQDLLDLEDRDLQNQRRLLLREISYLRSKSIFSKLRIDTGNTNHLSSLFSGELKRYLTAFKREDKESVKLIQAGSYAYSFYRFLREIDLLKADTSVVFNVVGYSDRGLSAISASPANLDVLATCSEIYKNEPKEQEILEARHQVLNIIQRNAALSFEQGWTFVKQLLDIPSDAIASVTHSERIEGFSSTLELREPHAKLIEAALESEDIYVFLTGNPGIGKTTAIVEFLKLHVNEGFLFFYVSPRRQVNLDIIEKFKEPDTQRFFDQRVFCINTNSTLLDDHSPHCTVNYHCKNPQGDFHQKSVDFFDASQTIQRPTFRQHSLKRITDDRLKAAHRKRRGVLSALCEAIYTVIDSEISNHIVATACIQSLKVTPEGQNTLRHFKQIFKKAYNQVEGKIIPSEMRKISRRIKHLFIMIDEITGDESGVEFFKEIHEIITSYGLTNPQSGFNTKIIVADASIVNLDVIKQHLSVTSPEPDKIFFRRVNAQVEIPLSTQKFKFKQLPATVINANSYPASSLNVTYKLWVESVKFTEKLSHREDQLKKSIQLQIVEDIHELLERGNGQLLVYIQDKRRLQELISLLKKKQGEFEKNREYLEIHASLSDREKQEIQDYKNLVQVIFMTSAASRGISFPKARYILVEIPRFRVENNLMEIIQVIYRCRGEYIENKQEKTLDAEEKELFFYLRDRAIYYDRQDHQIAIKESILSLLNILLILKISMMTRIQGCGKLGRHYYQMIPIGGKSISAVGKTFSGQMASLIKDLKSEYYSSPEKQSLKEVYTRLEQLLSQAEFVLSSTPDPRFISYLELKEKFNQNFAELLSNSFEPLLNFGNLEPGLITGTLLVVPITERKLEETYEIKLSQISTLANSELLDMMLAISYSEDYPENLRSAIKDAIELIDKLRDKGHKSQQIEQESQRLDQYYALPLFALIAGEKMKEYFTSEPEEPEDERFRDILATYIHHLYPTDKTLPIGYHYKEFPFVIFSSYSLERMREKIFTEQYLLTSNELNILNLILAQET
ncbi:MAG: helicase C-terminal domain-containing protein [Actinomycetota bacterium]